MPWRGVRPAWRNGGGEGGRKTKGSHQEAPIEMRASIEFVGTQQRRLSASREFLRRQDGASASRAADGSEAEVGRTLETAGGGAHGVGCGGAPAPLHQQHGDARRGAAVERGATVRARESRAGSFREQVADWWCVSGAARGEWEEDER